jgi:hypothetical protein
VVIDASSVTANQAIADATSGTGALARGAGVSASGGTLEIRGGALIGDNGARAIGGTLIGARAFGGGISITGEVTTATLDLDRARVIANRAEATSTGTLSRGRGAGAFVQGTAVVMIVDSTVESNVAQADGTATSVAAEGGGVTLDPDTTAAIQAAIVRSTLSGNISDARGWSTGGALDATVAGSAAIDLSIVECTVSGNQVVGGATTAGGGGLSFSWSSATSMMAVRVDSSTITANRVLEPTGNGGGIYSFRAATGALPAVFLRGTILSGNTAATGPDCTTAGTSRIESVGYDLLGDVSDCALIGVRTGDLTGVDPSLALLADNGGPTETHMIGAGGAAHDAGDPAGCTDGLGSPLTVDQRGLARPVGRCDIGAVERAP